LHKAAHASPSFQILSFCPLIDDKNQPISMREIGQLLQNIYLISVRSCKVFCCLINIKLATVQILGKTKKFSLACSFQDVIQMLAFTGHENSTIYLTGISKLVV